MGSTGDFPFDIEQVASLLPIKSRRPAANGVYTDCPFCGDDRGKLKINYENNTWRCNYCGEKGGIQQNERQHFKFGGLQKNLR